MEIKTKKNFKSKSQEKKELIEELWRIRREENFTSWEEIKKELGY